MEIEDAIEEVEKEEKEKKEIITAEQYFANSKKFAYLKDEQEEEPKQQYKLQKKNKNIVIE